MIKGTIIYEKADTILTGTLLPSGNLSLIGYKKKKDGELNETARGILSSEGLFNYKDNQGNAKFAKGLEDFYDACLAKTGIII